MVFLNLLSYICLSVCKGNGGGGGGESRQGAKRTKSNHQMEMGSKIGTLKKVMKGKVFFGTIKLYPWDPYVCLLISLAR